MNENQTLDIGRHHENHQFDAELRRLSEENAQLRATLDDCAKYLKEGETPAQRIQREIDDNHAVLGLLAKERTTLEAIYSTPAVAWMNEERTATYTGDDVRMASYNIPLIPKPTRKS